MAQKFNLDHTACEGEMAKANLSAGSGQAPACYGVICSASAGHAISMAAVGKGCMADRGYMQVPEGQRGPGAVLVGTPAGPRQRLSIIEDIFSLGYI